MSLVDFLKRSQVGEWAAFYADLDVLHNAIERELGSSKKENPKIKNAIDTLEKHCVDFQISVRCSFHDGWIVPPPRPPPPAAAPAAANDDDNKSPTSAGADRDQETWMNRMAQWLSAAKHGSVEDGGVGGATIDAVSSIGEALSDDDDLTMGITDRRLIDLATTVASPTVRDGGGVGRKRQAGGDGAPNFDDEDDEESPQQLKSYLALSIRNVRCILRPPPSASSSFVVSSKGNGSLPPNKKVEGDSPAAAATATATATATRTSTASAKATATPSSPASKTSSAPIPITIRNRHHPPSAKPRFQKPKKPVPNVVVAPAAQLEDAKEMTLREPFSEDTITAAAAAAGTVPPPDIVVVAGQDTTIAPGNDPASPAASVVPESVASDLIAQMAASPVLNKRAARLLYVAPIPKMLNVLVPPSSSAGPTTTAGTREPGSATVMTAAAAAAAAGGGADAADAEFETKRVAAGYWVVRLVPPSSSSPAPSDFLQQHGPSSPGGASSSVHQQQQQQLDPFANADQTKAGSIFFEVTAALTTLHRAYNSLAKVFIKEIRKITAFYTRQSEIIASAVASCIDAAKCAKFLSDRRRTLYIAAFREAYTAVEEVAQFCEQNIVGITQAFDTMEQALKRHVTLDVADALVKLPFALTTNSGLQLLRGDLIDAFRRSYLIVKLAPDLVQIDQDEPGTALPTPASAAGGGGAEPGGGGAPDREAAERLRLEKEQQEEASGELRHPIPARAARQLLQNSGASGGYYGDEVGIVGGRGGGGGGGGGGAGGGGVGASWWSAPRSMFTFLFGMSIALCAAAATDLFSIDQPNQFVQRNTNTWWHFTILISVAMILFIWGCAVFVWEAVGVNYVFLFSLDPTNHWQPWELLRNSAIYFFWWSVCAYAYCRRAVHETTAWELRFALLNWTASGTLQGNTKFFDQGAADGPEPVAWIFPYLTWPLFVLTWIYLQTWGHDPKRRRWFLPTLARVIVTPWHSTVTYSDFILAAMCVTFGTMLFEMQYFWCTFQHTNPNIEGACYELRSMRILFLRAIPIMWRLMQCLRNHYKIPDSKRTFFPHGVNACKYGVVILVLGARFFAGAAKRTWSAKKSDWLGAQHDNEELVDGAIATFFVISSIDSIFRGTWDVLIDAGLKAYGQKAVPAAETLKLQQQIQQQQQQQQLQEQQAAAAGAGTTATAVLVGEEKAINAQETTTDSQPVGKDDSTAVAATTAGGGGGGADGLNKPQKAGGGGEWSGASGKKLWKKMRHATTAAVANLPTLDADALIAAQPMTPGIFVESPSSSSSSDDSDNDDDTSSNSGDDKNQNDNNNLHNTVANSSGDVAQQQEQPQRETSLLLTATNASPKQKKKKFSWINNKHHHHHLRSGVDAKQRQMGIRSHLDEVAVDQQQEYVDESEAALLLANSQAGGGGADKNASSSMPPSSPPASPRTPLPSTDVGPCGWPLRPLLLPLWYYPFYCVVDIIIRWSWIGRWFAGQETYKRAEWIPFVFSALAILRRFIWLVVRVENEQVNNIELYKVTKAAPPPNRTDESQLDAVWDSASNALTLNSINIAVREEDKVSRVASPRKRPTQMKLKGSHIDRFFAMLPQKEKVAICSIAIPLTHRKPPLMVGTEFEGKIGEGKARWFSSLRAELKVHALLRRIGRKRTMNEYAAAVGHTDAVDI